MSIQSENTKDDVLLLECSSTAGGSMKGYAGFEKLSLSIKMNIYISLEKEMATVASSLTYMDRGA